MTAPEQEVALAKKFQEDFVALENEISKVIVGQKEVVKTVLLSIFCNGHSLLIGVPGLAKTLLINTISKALDLDFKRIQFTPDLMPMDISGSEILDENRQFKFLKGPIFANIILADEINRTPPKTQSALLEAMQEKNVTVGGHNYELPKPFFVLATQNPIEQEGTYPLPEAQLDRFMFNIILDYPSPAEEINILKNTTGTEQAKLNSLLNANQIIQYQELVRKIPVADNVFEYTVKLVNKTRPGREGAADIINQYVEYGAGPRAGQNLILGAKCFALMNGKFAPDIEDVKSVAKAVLRHRIVKNYRAEAENIPTDNIIAEIL